MMKKSAEIIPIAQTQAKPRISVVMVTFMTGPALFEAVSAVLNDRDIYELVIVDNGNSEAARQILSEHISKHANVRLLQGQGNIGFAKGCNYGAEIAKGDYFLFLNPDAIIAPGSAVKMALCGRQLNVPWAVGGLVRNEDGREQRGSRRDRLTPFSASVSFLGLHRLPFFKSLHLENTPLPASSGPVSVVSGAFMMTDKASFEQLGGFDEAYFLHVEDIDFCERIHRHGGQVYIQPAATAMHYGSTSKVTRQRIEWEKLKGFIHYFWKFSDSWWQKLLTAIAVPFMAIAVMTRAYWIMLKSGFTTR